MPNKGYKATKEHREKISNSHKGKKPQNLERLHDSNIGKKRTIESRKKMSVAKKGVYFGEKHWNWKGGRKDYPYEFHEDLKNKVGGKFDFECACCLISQKDLGLSLSVHHIDENKSNNVMDNLLPLCQPCHQSLHRSF